MKTKFSGILTLLLVLVVQLTFAQSKTITGTVNDDSGLPLPGANVLIKGTNAGTQTDFDGKFSITADVGQTIVFSYIGFDNQEVVVGDQTSITIQLVSGGELEEVVVLAYKTTTDALNTTATQTITAETIEGRPNPSVIQTLQGQVAGLNIVTNTGQPGGNSTINLRGIRSVNGNTEPLVIMDGIRIDEDVFRNINPNDIESVSVLKDAGATAIYGNEGTNGAIIITTKSGKYGEGMKISYSNFTSFSDLQNNDYNLKNTKEQLELERLAETGLGNGLTDAEIAEFSNTEWLDVFFRQGLAQNHNLSISTGGENFTTFTSLGYFEQEGILVQSDLNRFSFRNNITGKSEDSKFNYSTNLNVSYSKSNEPNNTNSSGAVNRSYILGALQSVPYLTPSDYTTAQALIDNGPVLIDTPLFLLDRLQTFERFDEELKILASANASWEFVKNLTAGLQTGADYTQENALRFEGPNSFNALLFAETGNDTPGFEDNNLRRSLRFINTTSLKYSNTWDKHTVNVGVYTEYIKNHFRSSGFRQNGLNPINASPGDDGGFIIDNDQNDFFVPTVNANVLSTGSFSYFGDVDWDYSGKYGLGAILRSDSSSRFIGDNETATFFAFSGRWNISEESFMNDSAFDQLKLRASYGETGNQRIINQEGILGPYAASQNFLDTFGANPFNGETSLTFQNLGNVDLRWETVKQYNIGLDYGVFDNRLRGSLDYYNAETEDLFRNIPVSVVNGVFNVPGNIGGLLNTGIDLTLNYDILRKQDFRLTFNLVGNYNKIENVDIPTENGQLINGSIINENGRKLNEYYLIRYSRVNPENGNLLFLDAAGNETEAPDPDADRIRTDKSFIPDFQGSVGFDAAYKGFNLNLRFNYQLGAYRIDQDLPGFLNPANIGTFRHSNDIDNAWTQPGDITDIPSLDATNVNNFNLSSDRFLISSDYLRLRFVELAYNLPQNWLDKTFINSARLYTNAENLVTITDWRGFDVENNTANGTGFNQFPTPKIFTVGFDIQF